MISFDLKTATITFSITTAVINRLKRFCQRHTILLLIVALALLSIGSFIYYALNGLDLAYNDARSHLDIARRVVENLKPGLAQLGSVWLPLPHILMIFTVWNSFMWHSGLAGALQSMISFVATGMLIYLFLKELQVSMFGRLVGVAVFAFNLNMVYMQSTAMTELLLMATMTAGAYNLLLWFKDEDLFLLIRTAFWILLSTLIRYDGWFLLFFSALLIFLYVFRKYGYKTSEGMLILFGTLAGFGIFLWLLWNQLIFKDALYFMFGPYAASTQQDQLQAAGALPTKHNAIFSLNTYYYAVIYNSGIFSALFAVVGAILLWFDKRISPAIRVATIVLLAPFFFNVLALYLGHSVLYVKNLNGSWFNVRYGLMMLPAIAVFAGYFVYRVKYVRFVFLGLFVLVTFFSFVNSDAVTIDDALIGASGKNVTEVSGWLKNNALQQKGFVLISVASHDAIIFSSGLPMSRFIHEGTGDYWTWATTHPSRWARWIILRTYDSNDNTYKLLQTNKEFMNDYTLIHKYPFADIYEIKPEYVGQLQTEPVSFANKR